MSPEQPSVSNARRYLSLALKLTVSIILLAVLFRNIDVRRLWLLARHASVAWLAAALGIYAINVLVSIWRWRLLLVAQHVHVRPRWLLGSFLVASFFNNFLPSNIGGDVIRISDTAKPARSKTLAATVILTDRGLGVMALVLVAALGATASRTMHPAALPIWPVWLWAGFLTAVAASAPAVLAPAGFSRLLRPLTIIHPEWVGDRLDTITKVLTRYRETPSALLRCFAAAVFVQATMVAFYFAVAYALHLTVALTDLAVIVPISFVIQMLPVSVNGLGLREATFSFYFARLGLPIEAALVISLLGAGLVMLFSLSGAAVYVVRGT